MGRSLWKTAYVVVALTLLMVPTSVRAQVAVPVATPIPTVSAAPATSAAAITRVECANACLGGGAIRPGSLLRVHGKSLNSTDEVVFMGTPGDADDVVASAAVRRKTSVDVRVPFGAAAGLW